MGAAETRETARSMGARDGGAIGVPTVATVSQ